jgi:peptidoglycan/LPS O-acetylase OafA/YrhL
MNKADNYYPQLDSLRFLAFTLVLINHAPFAASIPAWVTVSSYGWVGVDLFLCLSSFLFAKLLFVEFQRKGAINIKYFYLRRALRIWPLYFFFITFLLILTIYTLGWSNMAGANGTLSRFLGLFTFTDNIFSMILGFNLSVMSAAHLWTISYEEQFYLVIPWALRFFYKQKTSLSLAIIGGLALLGMLIRGIFIFNQVSHPAIWVFPLTHFDSILGGLALGLGLFDPVLKKIPSWPLLITGLIAVWLVTLLPNVNFIQWKLMLTYPLVGIGFTLILAAFIQPGLWPISSWMNNKVLGHLGKISYGLYVFHFACLFWSKTLISQFVSPERLVVYPVVVLVCSLALTIVISLLSYQFLEKPFLRLKARFTFVESRAI